MTDYDPDAVKNDLRMLATSVSIDRWMTPVLAVIAQMPAADLPSFTTGAKSSVAEYCFVRTTSTALQLKRRFDGSAYSFEGAYAHHDEPKRVHELYAGDNFIDMLYALFAHCAEQQNN